MLNEYGATAAMKTEGETEGLLVPIRSLQVQHDLPRNGNQAAAVGSQGVSLELEKNNERNQPTP
jgi:hypothetical protein